MHMLSGLAKFINIASVHMFGFVITFKLAFMQNSFSSLVEPHLWNSCIVLMEAKESYKRFNIFMFV